MKKLIYFYLLLTSFAVSHTASESGQIRDKIDAFLHLPQAERLNPTNYYPFLEFIKTVEPGNNAALSAFAEYRQAHPTAFNNAHPIMRWLLQGNEQQLTDLIKSIQPERG